MLLTPSQAAAISGQGNVLVMAGAGTGKTRTLVERCLNCVTQENTSIDEILMVTFTEAAAAEMRQRIRIRLEEELEKSAGVDCSPSPRPSPPGRGRQAAGSRWQEQLALFESAHIGTLHGFCLQLIRQHFYLLEVDPQLSVLAEEEARLLAEEALDQIFEPHYAGQTEAALAVQELLQSQGGSDRPLRSLLLRIHHYTQTLPDPGGWFERELARFSKPEPQEWEQWFRAALSDFRERGIRLLGRQAINNEVARDCLAALSKMPAKPDRAEAGKFLALVPEICAGCKQGKKTEWLGPLEDFCAESDFLLSLCVTEGKRDPLAEDWEWVRQPMLTLLGLAKEFSETFAASKRELGMADFHDLEQFALRLLWDVKTEQPGAIARQWREKLRFVFVDEYQDINAAQDKIIEALSRSEKQANRFLVGDVKQSIYRFRLANPRIFQNYMKTWRPPLGTVIPLLENFRSREAILNFINSLFATVMRENLGGIEYDNEAQLRFGAPAERQVLAASTDKAGKPELHLRVKSSKSTAGTEDASSEIAALLDLQETEKEARLAALRLLELKADSFPVWDDETKSFRPVEWSDMAILLRSPANKAESYAKEFQRAGVPLRVERGGFYRTLEISDLLSLFQILDNPLQDIPLLAVLHSPLAGLGINELATIRLAAKGTFWSALLQAQAECSVFSVQCSDEKKSGAAPDMVPGLCAKVNLFLERFARWRRLARRASLSRCLEAVLSETHYDSWLLTQPRGEMRHANVQRLLHLTQQFDQFQRQGLFRFLCFVEAQQLAEAEPEAASAIDEDAVRLMSIHQSKGLEFPVVVIGDLAKPFNLMDLRADVLLDEEFGLCPRVKPPQTGKTYPSLPLWLGQRRQKRELLGEELRLLYVAMTRARDKLILTGTLSQKRMEQFLEGTPAGDLDPESIAQARSYADWIAMWFSGGGEGEQKEGETDWLSWKVHDDAILLDSNNGPVNAKGTGMSSEPILAKPQKNGLEDIAAWERIGERLAWQYPFRTSTLRPAKTSVSRLRHSAAEQADEEMADTSGQIRYSRAEVRNKAQTKNLISAAELGTLHHFFLQQVSLEKVGTIAELQSEVQRLAGIQAFSKEEGEQLDLEAIGEFWKSEIGKQIRQNRENVRRELAFTARFSQAELDELLGRPSAPELSGEFAVVQGVADLVVILPEEIWLVDFKTDRVSANELDEKRKLYSPQLKLYAMALSRIYRKPMTRSWLYFLSAKKLVASEAGADTNIRA